MLSDEQFYLKKVDQTLERLRAICLGQTTLLSDILPSYLQLQATEEQARQISEQILFALAKVSSEIISPGQMLYAQKWMQGSIHFLLQECNADDQTFKELKRLLLLPHRVRRIFFQTFCQGTYKELLDENPPAIFKDFDGAIWWLLCINNLSASPKDVLEKSQNLL